MPLAEEDPLLVRGLPRGALGRAGRTRGDRNSVTLNGWNSSVVGGHKSPPGSGSKFKSQGYAAFGPCFQLPGFHVWYRFFEPYPPK